MPYVVVILAETMDDAKRAMNLNHPEDGPPTRRTVGIWKTHPTDVPVCHGRCGGTGWTRHQHGFHIHNCGKRMPWALSLNSFARGMFDRFGKNLLNRRLTHPDFQNPEGY